MNRICSVSTVVIVRISCQNRGLCLFPRLNRWCQNNAETWMRFNGTLRSGDVSSAAVRQARFLLDSNEPQPILAPPCGLDHERPGDAMEAAPPIRDLEQFVEFGPSHEVVHDRGRSVDL